MVAGLNQMLNMATLGTIGLRGFRDVINNLGLKSSITGHLMMKPLPMKDDAQSWGSILHRLSQRMHQPI
jgi:hypothetical protein